MTPSFIFLDLETTGLEAGVDQITEAAWVYERLDGTLCMRQAFIEHDRLPNEWVLTKSDYLTRILPAKKIPLDAMLKSLAWDCAELREPHLVGACPAFDDRFLRAAYAKREKFPNAVPYHYHIIDVEAMAFGLLGLPKMPSLAKLRSVLGIEGANDAPHTALSDALEAKLIFDAIRAKASA